MLQTNKHVVHLYLLVSGNDLGLLCHDSRDGVDWDVELVGVLLHTDK